MRKKRLPNRGVSFGFYELRNYTLRVSVAEGTYYALNYS
jgi:hypothetical protein